MQIWGASLSSIYSAIIKRGSVLLATPFISSLLTVAILDTPLRSKEDARM
jgi:hypothetical protein